MSPETVELTHPAQVRSRSDRAGTTLTRDDVPFHMKNPRAAAQKKLSDAVSSGLISEAEASMIREYMAENPCQNNTAFNRMWTILKVKSFFDVPLTSMSIADIYSAVERMHTLPSKAGKPYSQNTLRDFIRTLKSFVRWAVDNEYLVIPEKKLKRIKLPKVDLYTTQPHELLTPSDVESLIQTAKATRHAIRNQAIIATQYETGCRIGELASLTWGGCKWDDYGVGINIWDNKRKQYRYTRVISGAIFLARWRDQYPLPITPDSLVFVNENLRPFTYIGMVGVFKMIARKSGIEKRVHTHLFRKSHITHLVAQGLPETIIKKQHWNNPSTQMMAIYTKLSEQDIDAAILRHAGIEAPEKQIDPALTVFRCPQCQAINRHSAKFCDNCGLPFSDEVKADYDAALKYAEAQPEFQFFRLRLEKEMQKLHKKMEHTNSNAGTYARNIDHQTTN